MNNKRINRISEEVKKVVSEMLINGIKDPRISDLSTVTKVEVTRDLRFAKIYISVLEEDKKKETMDGLNKAKGFIRREIGQKIDLRYAPEPLFYLDESIEHGIYMSKLIQNVNQNSSYKGEEDNE